MAIDRHYQFSIAFAWSLFLQVAYSANLVAETPKANEIVPVDQPYNITWYPGNAPGAATVSINLNNNDGSASLLTASVDNTGVYTWHPNIAFAGETDFFISICPLNDSNPDDGCGVTFDGRFSFGSASSPSSILIFSTAPSQSTRSLSSLSTISTASIISSASLSSLSPSATTKVQSSTTSTQSTSSSQTTTATSSPSHKISTGAVAAMSTVIPIAAVAAAIIGGYMLWRKRKTQPNYVLYGGVGDFKAELPSESRGVSSVNYGSGPTQDRAIAEMQEHELE